MLHRQTKQPQLERCSTPEEPNCRRPAKLCSNFPTAPAGHCSSGREQGASGAPTLPRCVTISTSTSRHCASRTACSRLLTCAMARAACQPDPKPTTWGVLGVSGEGRGSEGL